MPTFQDSESEAMEHYREFGFHVEPNLVPLEWCNKVIELAHTFPNAKDQTFRPIPMPHQKHPTFLATMKLPQIVHIVEKLIGSKASGLGGEVFYMPPGTPGFAPHQDNAYVQAPAEEFISAWTALCDVTASNGGLTVFPGTHKLGLLPTRAADNMQHVGQNPGARASECILPEGWEPLDIEVKRGSTVFFHSLLVHKSNSNVTSDRFRFSFLATYLRKGAPFRPGKTQRRTEIDLHKE